MGNIRRLSKEVFPMNNQTVYELKWHDTFLPENSAEKLCSILNINRKPFSEISIDRLGLKTLALNALLRAGKATVRDLLNSSAKELLRIQGLGAISVHSILDSLHRFLQEHPELVKPCNTEDEAEMEREETLHQAKDSTEKLKHLFSSLPESVKHLRLVPLLRAFEAAQPRKQSGGLACFLEEQYADQTVSDFAELLQDQAQMEPQLARLQEALDFTSWLGLHNEGSFERSMRSIREYLCRHGDEYWSLLCLRAGQRSLSEAAAQLGLDECKAADLEKEALRLFHKAFSSNQNDLVMMVYAFKTGDSLVRMNELTKHIGEMASVLRFACVQGQRFKTFKYLKNQDAFQIKAAPWEYQASEVKQEKMLAALPFRRWLEENSEMEPIKIDTCICELIMAQDLAVSADFEHASLFEPHNNEGFLTITALWTLDAFWDLNQENNRRYSQQYFPLLSQYYQATRISKAF